MLLRVAADAGCFPEHLSDQVSICWLQGAAQIGLKESQSVRQREPGCGIIQLSQILDDPDGGQSLAMANSAQVEDVDSACGVMWQQDVSRVVVLMMQTSLMHPMGHGSQFGQDASGFANLCRRSCGRIASHPFGQLFAAFDGQCDHERFPAALAPRNRGHRGNAELSKSEDGIPFWFGT